MLASKTAFERTGSDGKSKLAKDLKCLLHRWETISIVCLQYSANITAI